MLRKLLEHVEHGPITRQIGQLRLPRVRSEVGKRRLAYREAKAYNEFPSYLQDNTRMSRFKADLCAMLGAVPA